LLARLEATVVYKTALGMAISLIFSFG